MNDWPVRDRRLTAAALLRARAAALRVTRGVAVALVACAALVVGAADAAAASSPPTPRIVNGVATQEFPSAGALLSRSSGFQFCSAVLVGCQTALTAAHCVCPPPATGDQCQPDGPSLTNPASLELFFQHAGFFSVDSIAVPQQYDFGERDDIAVLHLTEPVEGIQPTPLNQVERLALGTTVKVVGFGLAGVDIFDNGIKRAGNSVTDECALVPVPSEEYLCWQFKNPLGPPGTDVNTCEGDSGGPLFYNFGSGNHVAGINSGGLNRDCQPDDLVFDADVFANQAEIIDAAGSDLVASCGTTPVVGGPAAIELRDGGQLASGQHFDRTFQVPAGARELRVGLNAEEGLLINDFDVILYRGGAPPSGQVECASTREGGWEYCEIPNPSAGTWNARAVANSGDGAFQLTTTILREVDLGPCVPGPTTLCIDDAPHDGRFQASIAWDTSHAGGLSGLGNAIELDSLGITSGGVFWFFERKNPEVLLKVLNACGANGHYWVFWSAGTDVHMVITVLDRRTGEQRVYQNLDLHPALPVTDLFAFDC
jgi:hypothetical protein